jgi:rubredoxin
LKNTFGGVKMKVKCPKCNALCIESTTYSYLPFEDQITELGKVKETRDKDYEFPKEIPKDTPRIPTIYKWMCPVCGAKEEFSK